MTKRNDTAGNSAGLNPLECGELAKRLAKVRRAHVQLARRFPALRDVCTDMQAAIHAVEKPLKKAGRQ